MLKFFLPFLLCSTSIFGLQIPDAKEELQMQLTEIKKIEQGFNYILMGRYKQAEESFEAAKLSIGSEGYFSSIKYQLITFGELIIYAFLEDLDVRDVMTTYYTNEFPNIVDSLFQDTPIIPSYVGKQLNEEIISILYQAQEDYYNPKIINFDFGIGRMKQIGRAHV